MEVFSAFVRYFVKDDATAEMKKVQGEAKKTAADADSAGEQANSRLSALGGVAAKVGAAVLSAVAAGVAALGKLGKAALSSYADYEQLVGGVETLFGNRGAQSIEEYAQMVGKSVDEVQGEYERNAAAQEMMMNNAANAYRTAGMSANEYMETATSSAAAMVSSLGGDTQKAAELVDMSVTDMADNANKMGSDIGSIQQAYAGFSKQNFSMLDNLKLGYGGSREEMQRLLDDAEKISGIKYDISSYADVTQAIHVMQTEMGITGTTAKEAASTISGSLSMTKAAYSNFITGLADDNADMGALTDNLMSSIDALAGNVVPRLVTIMGSISDIIPVIVPKLLDAATQILNVLIEGVASALPGLLSAVVGALSQIAQAIVQALPAVLSALVGLLPEIMLAIMQLLTTIVQILPQLLMQVLPAIVQAIVGVTQAFVQALPAFIEALTQAIVQIVQYLPVFLPQLIEAATQLLMAIVYALPTIVEALTTAIPQIIQTVCEMLPTLLPAVLSASIQLFMALVQSLPIVLPQLLTAIIDMLPEIISTLISMIPQLIQAGVELFLALVQAVPMILGELLGAIGNLLGQAWNAISHFDLAGAAYDMVAGMVRGISDAAGAVWDAIVNVCSGALDAIRGFFGIASPSKVMRATFRWIPEGGALGIDDEASMPVHAITDLGEEMQKAANAAVVTMPAPRIDAGALAGVSVSGAASGGLAGASAAGVARGVTNNINVTTGETDPSKLARMIARAEQRQAYALGTI